MEIITIASSKNSVKYSPKHEKLQNKALTEIWKHYQETGDFSPARIDYFEGQEPKITYLNNKNKLSQIFQNAKIYLLNLLKKIKK